MYDTLAALVALPGVSGRETPVREELARQLEPLCQLSVDPLGNLIAFKKGRKTPKNKILLSAHMDEVGFIITYIEENGMLRFAPVGGIDSRLAVGKRLKIGPGAVPGVIGFKAIHQQSSEERGKVPSFEELYLDIGALSRQEALEQVQLGDTAIFDTGLLPLGEDKLLGRALDNRAGCALLLELLQKDLEYDVTAAFTVMEETGCQGARTVAAQVEPDIALILETTTASDIPGVSPENQVCHLGKGPVVSFQDRGTVYDWELYRAVLKLAQEKNIPCQSKAGVYGGNESRSFQTGACGARVAALSLPCRYLHSPACMLDRRDLDSMAALLEALIPVAATL